MANTVEVCSGPNLFIDNFLIAESRGLTRNTHQPEKLAEPVLRKAESWHTQPQWFFEVKRNPMTGGFRVWYNLKNFMHSGPGGSGPGICYAYAESMDGISWQRPNLGLMEADGSRDNNLIDAPIGHFGLFLVDDGPDCSDPSRRYKMAYYGEGLCLAFSPDGFRFTEHPDNPLIRASANDIPFPEPGYENVISDIIDGCWDPLKGEYLLGCKIERSGYPGKPHHHAEGWRRCVGMSTSRDFVNWKKPQLVVVPDPNNGIEEFYGFKPIVRGNLYIGFLRVLRDDLPATPDGPVEGIGWTELMTSRDGLTWNRCQEAFIDRGTRPDSWDHAMAWYADCITVGDKDYVYYGGYSAGHKVGDREVGLAMLRKNGFVSRDAGRAGGLLKTPLAMLPGEALSINAAVRDELRVRLVDDRGQALSGFDWVDCIPVRGDSVSHPVTWRRTHSLPTSRPVSLEISLKDAELYGFDAPARRDDDGE